MPSNQSGTLLLHFKKEQLLCALLPKRLTGEIVWAEWGPVPMQLRRGPARWLVCAGGAARTADDGHLRGDQALDCAGRRARRENRGGPESGRCPLRRLWPSSRTELRRAWGVEEETLVLGCISRFHPTKRNDVVIDAMAYLEEENVLLVLAGEGEQEEELRVSAPTLRRPRALRAQRARRG